MTTRALIMCGGSGTRLAPRTTRVPKQFLDLLGIGRTMIQDTARRLAPLVGNDIVVVTNPNQAGWVRDQLPSAQLVLEPVARNTAPAIALAAITMKSDDIMMVFPSDHVFGNEAGLMRCLRKGVEIVKSRDMLVTIGIAPTRPHTGLGHIKRSDTIAEGVLRVEKFVEKPPEKLAIEYFNSGQYLWNAGIFVWRAGRFMELLSKHKPAMYEAMVQIQEAEDQAAAVEEIFPKVEKISVDFAIMEKSATETAVVIGEDLGWRDIGDWSVFGEAVLETHPDPAGNATSGSVELRNCERCICFCDKGHLAVSGLHDVVIVKAEGHLLVCPVNKAQEVSKAADVFAACPGSTLNLGVPNVVVLNSGEETTVCFMEEE